MSWGAHAGGLVLPTPWDTSLNVSTAASAQESAEGNFAVEQKGRPEESLPEHPGFTSLKTNTTERSKSSHYACAQAKAEALPNGVEPQHQKHRSFFFFLRFYLFIYLFIIRENERAQAGGRWRRGRGRFTTEPEPNVGLNPRTLRS